MSDTTIENYARNFAETVIEVAGEFMDLESSLEKSFDGIPDLEAPDCVLVTLPVFGTVLCEYNLHFKKSALKSAVEAFMGEMGDEEELQSSSEDLLQEILNVVVGKCFAQLKDEYAQMTMMPPRTSWGRRRLPLVNTKGWVHKFGDGEFSTFVSVNKAEIDLASAYDQSLVSLQDLNTQLESAYCRLKEQQATLVKSERLAAIGEMAGGIAHEINNPLAIIMGKSQLIGNLLSKDDLQLEKVHQLQKSIDSTTMRISNIVSSLLKISRSDDDDEVRAQPARDLFENLKNVFVEKFKNANVTLDISEENLDVPVMYSDIPTSQVLVNLINNSFAAVVGTENAKVRVVLDVEGKEAVFRVIDSGPGIDPELRSKIFEAFFTTKEPGKGTGLGLSICKQIIESQNGKIFVDEKEPTTAIAFKLPLAG